MILIRPPVRSMPVTAVDEPDLAAGRLDLAGDRPGDRHEVSDRRLRRVQRREPGGVRLDRR